jgi:hypothetical protein
MDAKLKEYLSDTAKLVYIQCELTRHPCEGEDDEAIENILLDVYHAGCIAQAKADRVEIEKTKPPCGECNPGNGQCGFCSYTDNVDDFYEDVMARLAAAQIVKGG